MKPVRFVFVACLNSRAQERQLVQVTAAVDCSAISPAGNRTTKIGIRDCRLRSRQQPAPKTSLRPASRWAIDASHGYVGHSRPCDQKIFLSSNINELDGGEIEIRTLSMAACNPRKCRVISETCGPEIKILPTVLRIPRQPVATYLIGRQLGLRPFSTGYRFQPLSWHSFICQISRSA